MTLGFTLAILSLWGKRESDKVLLLVGVSSLVYCISNTHVISEVQSTSILVAQFRGRSLAFLINLKCSDVPPLSQI